MTHPAVPWGQLVHFFGRGDELPPLMTALWFGEAMQRQQAARQLAGYLEHQDSVMMATPFAVRALLTRLTASLVQGDGFPAELATVLLPVVTAVTDYLRNSHVVSGLTLDDVLAPEHLWPPFVSEDEDEALWEDWDASPELYAAFQRLTAEQLLVHHAALRQAAIDVASDCPEVLAEWQQLLKRMQQLVHVPLAPALARQA